MIEARRLAYLDAMDIDVWSARPLPAARDLLVLQPGSGETLVICQQHEETAGHFAGDLARLLSQNAVWAWPDPEGDPKHVTLEQAIGQQLFTRVIIFGETLASQLLKSSVPDVLGSARIIVAPALDELVVRGSAKLAFWNQLAGSGLN